MRRAVKTDRLLTAQSGLYSWALLSVDVTDWCVETLCIYRQIIAVDGVAESDCRLRCMYQYQHCMVWIINKCS